MWQEIWETIQRDFSDLPGVAQVAQMTLRLLLAAFCGGLLGFITGIGFLGAGTILKLNEQEEVRGLTTAAGIWLTAAVGIAAGMGREASAVLGTFLALVILSLLPRVTPRSPMLSTKDSSE